MDEHVNQMTTPDGPTLMPSQDSTNLVAPATWQYLNSPSVPYSAGLVSDQQTSVELYCAYTATARTSISTVNMPHRA
jgi:hypothetical protein